MQRLHLYKYRGGLWQTRQ